MQPTVDDGQNASTDLILVEPGNGELIASVVALGDLCRDTLGFLPRKVFTEMAHEGHVIAATVEGSLVGYTCFDVTRRYIRLVHLCVHPQYRGNGIARILLSELKRRHSNHPGILARCRNSYDLAPLWSQLGFRQRTEVKGRSHEGHPLTVWWHDLDQPDLFTRLDAEPLVEAAIDMVILRDLGSDSTRPDARESHAIIADHLVDRLALVSTPILAQEVATLEDPQKRLACHNAAQRLKAVHPARAEAGRVYQALKKAVSADYPGYPDSESDSFDLQHVASSIAADVPVFITRDDRMIARLSTIAYRDFGLRILRPADVIVHLDELVSADSFQPAALLGTHHMRQRIGAGHEAEILTLLNKTSGERKPGLLGIWRTAAIAGHERLGIWEPDKSLSAAWIIAPKGDQLDIPLLRVGPGRLADTLARQLVFRLRVEARDSGCSVITISDPHVSPAVEGALADDGFRKMSQRWHGLCLDICGEAQAVESAADKAARGAGLPPPSRLRSAMPVIAAAAVERAWWPAKITDSELPSYLLPIRQVFSTNLLGVPAGLFAREDYLALSRENVYYRSPIPSLDAPARILWYMSGSGRSVQPASVIGCSHLDDVVTGRPEELHDRFRHLAVWNLDLLRARSRNGMIQALRFANTEIFTPGVPLSRLKHLGRVFNEHSVPQGPTRVSAGLFAAIYKEGRLGRP